MNPHLRGCTPATSTSRRLSSSRRSSSHGVPSPVTSSSRGGIRIACRSRLDAFTCTSLLQLFSGCSNSSDASHGDDAIEPVFPENVAEWAEGRACGFTHEHELRYIRVVVDEKARVPHRELTAEHPYEVGATLVKLEYENPDCTNLLGHTAMQKQAPGYSESGNDWRWQRVTADRRVVEDGPHLSSCITCNSHHCTWPQCGYEKCGFDLSCGIEEQ